MAAAEAGAAAFGPVFGAADPAVVAGAVAPVVVFGQVPSAAGSPLADPHDSHSDSYCPGGRSLCWAGRSDSACWVEHSCYRCSAAAGLPVRQTAVGCFGCRADRSGCPGGRSLCWAGRLDSACWVEHSCYHCSAAAGLPVRPTAVGCFGCRADRSGYPAERPGW